MSETPREFSCERDENLQIIYEKLHHSEDIQKREFIFNGNAGVCIFLDTITDSEKIEKNLLEKIYFSEHTNLLDVITSNQIEKITDVNKAVEGIIGGHAIVFLQGCNEALKFKAKKDLLRSVEEPENEKVVRGSHEGFIESLSSNIQLIRNKLATPYLTVQYFTVGSEVKEKIAVVYLKNIADASVVSKISERIESIGTDAVFSEGLIEECIEDNRYSPFSQLLNTERPDKVMSNLLEGRVALIQEGSPSVYILPISFFSFFQSPDDYNNRFLTGSFYRLIRYFSLFIAVFAPAIYIATISFHFEVIPGELVIPVKNAVEEIPYPPIIEALIMEITIELIREAGLRLPTPIGQTIGIVGGLVIGDAVVQAGLVSNIMIIVVAITAIASFVVPSVEMNASLRIIRFPIMFAAATFGYFGIVFCFIFLLAHLCKLQSFGLPYLAPLSPLNIREMRDTAVRGPYTTMEQRPSSVHPKKVKRISKIRGWVNKK